MNKINTDNVTANDKLLLERFERSFGDRFEATEPEIPSGKSGDLIIPFKIKGYNLAKSDKFVNELLASLEKKLDIQGFNIKTENFSDKGLRTSTDINKPRMGKSWDVKVMLFGAETKSPGEIHLYMRRDGENLSTEATTVLNCITSLVSYCINKSAYYNGEPSKIMGK